MFWIESIPVIMFCIILYNAIISLISIKKSFFYCGIIAFSGTKKFDINKIKTLFLFNASRGTDGCGMYNDGKITKTKDDIYASIVKWEIKPEKIFLGHTRKSSTFNNKDSSHAHPFQCGNIIGIHNGTLTNHWQLGTYNDISSTNIDTDSEMLFNLINKSVSNLKFIKGTASIAYIDTTVPNTLYCFRKNDDRPLFRGKSDEGMYFSSMKESLECIGCTNIEELKVETLYSIVNGKIVTTTKYVNEDISKKTRHAAHSTYEMNKYLSDGYVEGYNYEDDYGQSIAAMNRHENYGIELGSKQLAQAIVNRHKIIANKMSWLRVKFKDDSCNDNHGRILIGDYVQTAEDIQDDSVYSRIIVHVDENGIRFPNNQTKSILYKSSCLKPLMIDSVNVFAIAMHNGTKSTMAGDIVYVKGISYPNSKQRDTAAELLYNAVYPESSVKRHEGKDYRWDREHFRLLETEELYALWKREKENTPEKIITYLQGIYTDVLQDKINNPKDKTSKIINIQQVNDAKDINNVLKAFEKINKDTAKSLIKQIHEQVVDNTDLLTAYKNVMINNNFLKESISNQNNAEEDDVNADDDTPPNDKAIIPFNAYNNSSNEESVFGDNVDEKILSTVWAEVGDSVDFITNLKNGIDNLRDKMSELYNAGTAFVDTIETGSGEAINFEDTEIFEAISSTNEQIEELDNNVNLIIENIMSYYPTYDPNYKK